MSSQMSDSLRQGLNPRQAETAEKLLNAGLDELHEVGPEALTVRTVAQRASVSPATAYTYLASKNHLFAELFWRHLVEEEIAPVTGTTAARVQAAVRGLVDRIAAEPALAAGVTPALLSADVDVARMRIKIGAEFLRRIESALAEPGQPADPAVLETLLLTFCGGLLQAGMGLMTYDEMAHRLAPTIDVILRGNS